MRALLAQLNAVPGVIGSVVCDAEGRLLAHAFPPTFEPQRLQEAALALADRSAALESALGAVGMLDLRFAAARVVVRAMPGARLLFLCTPSLNLELLAMSAAAALRGLERMLGSRPAAPAAPPAAAPAATPTATPVATAPGLLWQTVERIQVLIERSGQDPYRLRGQIALKAGFTLDLVEPDTPDDPARLQKLRAAALAVLGQPV
jgi:predicted regulator of Ras-like GTPase activity (Roadblock/LC7/MglB family)